MAFLSCCSLPLLPWSIHAALDFARAKCHKTIGLVTQEAEEAEEDGIDDCMLDSSDTARDLSQSRLLMKNPAADVLARVPGQPYSAPVVDDLEAKGHHMDDVYEDVPRIAYVSDCSDDDEGGAEDD